jgi:hypothetical protein
MWNKCNRTVTLGISVGGTFIIYQADISNTIASFSIVFSSDDCVPRFRFIKHSAEILPLTRVTKAYNTAFTMDEFLALERCRVTSPCPDGIHYEILSHLLPTGKEFLLSMCNHIWTESSVPEAWREATVVPVPIPGRDRSLATSYRLISLTNCPCKTMKRMVNRRLIWVQESLNLFFNVHCRFRRHRLTLDLLVNPKQVLLFQAKWN